MFAFQTRERRGRWSKYPAFAIFVGEIELFAKLQRIGADAAQVHTVNEQTREGHKRRIRMVLPVIDLFFVKTFVVLSARVA